MSRQRLTLVVVCAVLVVTSIGVVQAAVTGDFSTTYDADQSTDVPGREVQVDGTLEATGSNAVNPNIEVRSGPQTVLDRSSVELFVEGEQAVNFETGYQGDAVILRTDEIPTGTEVRIEFVVYPVGTNETNVTAAEVTVNSETPEGQAERQQFTPTVSLEDSPPQRVNSLQEETRQLEERVSQLEDRVGSSPDWRTRFWVLFGVVILVVVVVGGLYIIRLRNRNNGEPYDEPPQEPP